MTDGVRAAERRPVNPFGVAGLIVGAVAFVVAQGTGPLQVLAQVGNGSPALVVVLVAVEVLAAVATIVLGVVGLVLRRHSPASAAAALAVGCFLLLAPLEQLVLALLRL